MTSAHGHATTSSTSARYSHTSKGCPAASTGSVVTSAARITTAGVYHAAKRSMNCCTGARCDCAVSTRRTIRARVVSVRRRVTTTTSAPWPLMVPANTSSPSPFSTGSDSPVIGA